MKESMRLVRKRAGLPFTKIGLDKATKRAIQLQAEAMRGVVSSN